MKRIIFKSLLAGYLFFFTQVVFAQQFEFGGQIRFRREVEDNYLLDTNYKYTTHDYKQRSRLYAKVSEDDVTGMFEIENNSRWGLRTNAPNSSNDPNQLDESGDLYINNLYVETKIPGLKDWFPAYAKIGRQYFPLGRGLVLDEDKDNAPNPYDGASFTFDPHRNFGLTLVFINGFLARPTRSQRGLDPRGDNDVYGGYFRLTSNATDYLEEQHINPYYIEEDSRESAPTFISVKQFAGAYVEGELPKFMNQLGVDRIKYRAEYSKESGSKSAGGQYIQYDAHAAYFEWNVKWKVIEKFSVKWKGLYHYGTGDDPNTTKTDETFRSDYQNYQPSELFGQERLGSDFFDGLYGDEKMGTGGTNMQIVKNAIELEWKKWSWSNEYYTFTAAKVPNLVSNDLGNEYDSDLEYAISKHLTSHCIVAHFWAGNFFGQGIKPATKVEIEMKYDF